MKIFLEKTTPKDMEIRVSTLRSKFGAKLELENLYQKGDSNHCNFALLKNFRCSYEKKPHTFIQNQLLNTFIED